MSIKNDKVVSYAMMYCSGMHTTMSITGRTIKILLNRGTSLVAGVNQVFEGYLYLRDMGDYNHFMAKGIKVEAVYKQKYMNSIYMTEDGVRKGVIYDFVTIKLTEDQYTDFMGVAAFNNKKILRFYPTKWEQDTLTKTYQLFNGKDFKSVDLSMVPDLKRKFGHLLTILKGMKQMAEPEQIADLSVYSKSLKEKDTISVDEMRIWLHNRHDYFMREFLIANDLDVRKSDISMKDVIKTNLDINKTPDYCDVDGAAYHFLEFAVTDGNWVDVYNNKMDKYYKIICDLNDEQRTVFGVDVDTVFLHVVVLDKTDQSIRAAEHTRARYSFDLDLTSLYTMCREVESIPNYPAMKKLYESAMTEESITEALAMERSILETVLDVEVRPKRSVKLEVARDPKYIGKEKQAVLEELSTVDQDKDLQMVLKRTTSEFDYATAAVKDFVSDYRNGEVSFEVKKIIQTSKTETIAMKIDEMHTKNKELRENYLKKSKITRMFKVPNLPIGMVTSPGFLTDEFLIADRLDDGTMLIVGKGQLDFKNTVTVREGMGMDIEDVDMVEAVVHRFFKYEVEKAHYSEAFPETEFYKYLSFCEVLSREIMLMSERRFARASSPIHFTLKHFENFTLMMHKGPKIQADNTLFFKILITVKEKIIEGNDVFFKAYRETDIPNMYETHWMAITLADLEHFATIKGRAMALVMDYECKLIESGMLRGVRAISETMEIPKVIAIPIILMAEHKRGTSTALQNNRYLLHGFTSEFCDMSGLVDTIFEDPVRSICHSYVIQRQATWILKAARERASSDKHGRAVHYTDPDYDKLKAFSFFDECKVEFNILMNEIYLSNNFNKSHGHKSHREKDIMNKMAKMEKEYEKTMEVPTGKLTVKDTKEKDTYHIYSSEFLRAAVQYYKRTRMSEAMLDRVICNTLMRSVDEIMKMTKSVIRFPLDILDKVHSSPEVMKDFVFSAVIEQVRKLETNSLYIMVQKDKDLFAVFGTFAKDQIGHSREILIQFILTRFMTKFFNNFFEELCGFHEKEMITSESKKKAIQSDRCTVMRDEYMRSLSERSEYYAIPATINMDSSKWAPSMVMETYIEVIDELKLPKWLHDDLISSVRAYTCKALFAPKSIITKWAKKPANEKEEDPDSEWVRQRMDESGLVWFRSGMGQGNLHHPSSFVHVMIDDYSDYLIKLTMKSIGYRDLKCTSLISSDDVTKMYTIYIKKDRKLLIQNWAIILVDMFSRIRKLANIHVNWKKTAVQFIITEFNSMFSLGKRVCVASSKSIYNAFNIPDMTSPEKAVKEVLANIRRVLDDGCHLNTINVCMEEMRENLIKWMGYNDHKLQNLTALLNCTKDNLPFHIGFLPLEFPVETLIFGPELHMFKKENSSELMRFYKGMYTASRKIEDAEMLERDAEELVSSKVYIEVDAHLDKRFIELKKAYYDKEDLKAAMSEAEKYALDTNTDMVDTTTFYRFVNTYMLNVDRKYEFGMSYRANSTIRAMQYASNRVRVSTGTGTWTTMRMEDVVVLVMQRSEMKSMFEMFATMRTILMEAELNTEEIKEMKLVTRSTHPKIRTVKFYNTKFYKRATDKQIINALMSEGPDVKMRVISAAREVCVLLDTTLEDMTAKPFDIIKETFKLSERPFTSFREFIRFYNKTLMYTSSDMLLDFAPTENRKDNIKAIYQYKLVPGRVYTSANEEKLDRVEKNFINRFILLGSERALDLLRENSDLLATAYSDITLDETPIKLLMKLMALTDSEGKIQLPVVHASKVFYTYQQRANKKVWLTLSGITTMKEMPKKKPDSKANYSVTVLDYSNGFADMSLMKTAVRREIVKMRIVDPNIEIGGNTIEADINEYIDSRFTKPNYAKGGTAKLSFFTTASTWTAKLKIQDIAIRVAKGPVTVFTEACDSATEEKMLELDEIRRGDITLEKLDAAIREYMGSIVEVPLWSEMQSGMVDSWADDAEKLSDAERAAEMERFMSDMMAGFSNVVEDVIDVTGTVIVQEEVSSGLETIAMDLTMDSDLLQGLANYNSMHMSAREDADSMIPSTIPIKAAISEAVTLLYKQDFSLNIQAVSNTSKNSMVQTSVIFTAFKTSLNCSDAMALAFTAVSMRNNTLRLSMCKASDIVNYAGTQAMATISKILIKNSDMMGIDFFKPYK